MHGPTDISTYVPLTTLEKANASVSQLKKMSLVGGWLNWNGSNASWIIELKASADDTIVNFLWQSSDIKMAGLILDSCYYFDGK